MSEPRNGDTFASLAVKGWPILVSMLTFVGTLFVANKIADYRLTSIEDRVTKIEERQEKSLKESADAIKAVELRLERQSQILEDIRATLKNGR